MRRAEVSASLTRFAFACATPLADPEMSLPVIGAILKGLMISEGSRLSKNVESCLPVLLDLGLQCA